MPAPSIWGPATWAFFHTLAEHIQESAYPILKQELIQLLRMICANLPCPECAKHATDHMQRLPANLYATKQDFKNMLYLFHNKVNARKQKRTPPFNYALLSAAYLNRPLFATMNRFLATFNTRGNMNLINESFRRQLIIPQIANWMHSRKAAFQSPPRPSPLQLKNQTPTLSPVPLEAETNASSSD